MLSSVLLWTLVAQGGLKITTAPATPAPVEPVADREVVVEAGAFERTGSVVPLELGEDAGKRRWVLKDSAGRAVPFQVDEHGRGAFILEKLAAKQKATFRLSEDRSKTARGPAGARVKVDKSNPALLRVLVDGKPALEFQARLPLGTAYAPGLLRAGYISPVFTPKGTPVTEAYPTGRPHDLGIWGFWSQFQFRGQTIDFAEKMGVSGTIQLESMSPTSDGAVYGGFESRQIYTGIQLSGTTLLRDRWTVQVFAPVRGTTPYTLFDLESWQQAATGDPISVPKGTSGGIALRGRDGWAKGPTGVVRLTSESSPKADRVLWAYVGGTENGKTAGIVMLGHPVDYGFPQSLSATAGPFVNLRPTADKPVPIVPGQPLRLIYRFAAVDGPPDRALFSRLYNDYAFPPRATLRPIQAKKPAKN
jgi:hypothetical protein